MKNELDSKRIRNIYIMLIAILCMTIISTTAILSYVAVFLQQQSYLMLQYTGMIKWVIRKKLVQIPNMM